MAGPAAVVVAGLATYWIALRTPDGLVADDYYKRGLAINQTLARSELARSMDLEARGLVSDGSVSLELFARHDRQLPDSVVLTFVHPTRLGMDQSVAMRLEGARYTGALGAALAPGRWQVVVEDGPATWRLSAYKRFPEDARFSISARGPQEGMQ